MTREELAKFKNLLILKRNEILEELKSYKSHNTVADSIESSDTKSGLSVHIADHGTDTMEKEIKYYFASFGGNQLKELDQALERIENGAYGICSSCAKEIDHERLEALPQALKCISCKAREETC